MVPTFIELHLFTVTNNPNKTRINNKTSGEVRHVGLDVDKLGTPLFIKRVICDGTPHL